MPATPLKRPAFILTADAGTWELALELLEEATHVPGFGVLEEDKDLRNLIEMIRYKLWRTGHKEAPGVRKNAKYYGG